jgi:hypothetical protein
LLLFITKGSQGWNLSRSESRSWCRGHGGMFFTGLLSLLSYRTKTTSPERPTRGLSPLITNWENALQLDLMEAFPQLKLLSLWSLQLCQVDTKLASTICKYFTVKKKKKTERHKPAKSDLWVLSKETTKWVKLIPQTLILKVREWPESAKAPDVHTSVEALFEST